MTAPSTQADAALARARRLLHDHRTHAKRDGVALDYALPQLRDLLASSPTCAYCHTPLSFAGSLDHRMPTGRGGQHALANLAVCCARCNAAKGMLTEGEFMQLWVLLERLHPIARADIERRLIAGGTRYSTSRRRTTP